MLEQSRWRYQEVLKAAMLAVLPEVVLAVGPKAGLFVRTVVETELALLQC